MGKIILTYKTYGDLVDRLEVLIKVHKRFKDLKYIYGVPKGGMPLAVHLAHKLELTYIDVITPTYESPTFTDIHDSPEKRKQLLIVDDLTDTGVTLEAYSKNNGVLTATLFHKPKTSKFTPDIYVSETGDWIYFPWERLDEVPNRPGYEE